MCKLMWFALGLVICLSLGVLMQLGQLMGIPDAGFNVWLLLMTVALPISMAGINGLLPNQRRIILVGKVGDALN